MGKEERVDVNRFHISKICHGGHEMRLYDGKIVTIRALNLENAIKNFKRKYGQMWNPRLMQVNEIYVSYDRSLSEKKSEFKNFIFKVSMP